MDKLGKEKEDLTLVNVSFVTSNIKNISVKREEIESQNNMANTTRNHTHTNKHAFKYFPD